MKYIIDVPDEHTDIKVFYTDADMKIIQSMRCEPYTVPDRKAIEDEVWEFARAINYMGYDDFVSCFGGKTEEMVYELSYSEVKAEYEAWKDRKDEIRVGDEVTSKFGDGVVIDIVDGEAIHILGKDGHWNEYSNGEYRKTGRYFSEVAELLKKMKEGDRP